MMQHSLRKEAAELLCDAVQSRINDEEASHDVWIDSNGMAIPANRFCPDSAGEEHHNHEHHDEGPCMGIQVNIWKRAKKQRHLVHTLSGGSLYGGYDALDYRLILVHGDAGKLGKYPILSKLPDKVARFLYEFHDFHFQRLRLPPLPDDRSRRLH